MAETDFLNFLINNIETKHDILTDQDWYHIIQQPPQMFESSMTNF